MRFSSRVRAAAESRTLALSAEIARLRAGGADVVSLLEGEPDLPVPDAVIRATADALKTGRTKYSPSAGLPELREAAALDMRASAVFADAANILVTNGAKQAVYEVLQALCSPGDEVLVPSPYWVTFPEAVKLAGAAPVIVETKDGRLDVEALERAVTGKTVAVILNSPNNPTGVVCTDTELTALAELAARRDLTIVADEAYAGLVYDGREHLSAASIDKAAERTVTVRTFSKSFGMTGFRVGYACGPADLIKAAALIHGHVTGNVCTFAQHGALAALELGKAHAKTWRAEHQARRDLAYQLGAELFDCAKPEGGLFLWADVRKRLGVRHKDSAALAAHLLDKGRVAVVPGSACGKEGFLRVSFSSPEKTLREGFKRLAEAL